MQPMSEEPQSLQFEPHKEEKTLRAEITAREASLLKALRKYAFGKFTVHKANNILVRLESNESILIDEKEGLILEITGR